MTTCRWKRSTCKGSRCRTPPTPGPGATLHLRWSDRRGAAPSGRPVLPGGRRGQVGALRHDRGPERLVHRLAEGRFGAPGILALEPDRPGDSVHVTAPLLG